MPRLTTLAWGCFFAIQALFTTSHLLAVEPAWTGHAKYRVLVTVAPVQISHRESDTSVASVSIDFPELLARQKITGQFDPSSLHVHRIDSDTGNVIPFREGDKKTFDHPARFDDGLSPKSDLSRVGRASTSKDGLVQSTKTPRKARLFNRIPESTNGKIVWTHIESANRESTYAIYFDVIDKTAPIPVSPAPWIGDIDVLRRPTGESLGGFAHFTIAVGDLNGDGLFDIVAGTEKGDVVWFPNRGTAGKPRFDGCYLPEDQYGPIDCGWYAAPFISDWDQDGLPDLLIGTQSNAIVWWKNQGTKTSPKWQHVGFVQADGRAIAVPESPVEEDSNGIFKVDYYNQPWIGDLNGDGNVDIVTGGYTTGRIFLFAGTGRDANGLPTLALPVPVEADGQPIDTIWAAAPAIGDFDGDGLPDLITGAWFWSGIPRKPKEGEADFLMYFANVGTKSAPKFTRRAFPKLGELPAGNIARPCVIDLNGDGLLDLMVNDGGGNVFSFLNVGQSNSPKWDVQTKPLTVPWGFAKDVDISVAMTDLDGDKKPEFLAGNQLFTLQGDYDSPSAKHRGIVNVNGVPIFHQGPGYGDDYFYTWLADWNNDGLIDLLWGTHQGNIYLHLKSASGGLTSFEQGTLITLTTGEPLKVGPPVVKSAAEATDFTILQGSRILMATEDFDQDGLLDLMVSETYGNLWFFRRLKSDGPMSLAPGVILTKLPGRTESLVFDDWNHDGKPDLLLGGPPGKDIRVLLNTSQPGKPGLDAPQTVAGIPYVFWGAKPKVVDWNHDGDADIMIQSEFFSFFAERSFVERGYQPAELVTDAKSNETIRTRQN